MRMFSDMISSVMMDLVHRFICNNNNTAVLLKKFAGEEGDRVDVQKLFGG